MLADSCRLFFFALGFFFLFSENEKEVSDILFDIKAYPYDLSINTDKTEYSQ